MCASRATCVPDAAMSIDVLIAQGSPSCRGGHLCIHSSITGDCVAEAWGTILDRVKLWAAAKERLPFRVAQRILNGNGFPKGATWAAIEEKMADGHSGGSFQGLQQGLVESLAVSEKSLMLFTLSESEMKQCYSAITALAKNLPSSTLRESFPYLLPSKALAKLDAHSPVVVEVQETEHASVVIYSYVRVIENRVELPTAALSIDTSDYTSLIAIRRQLIQGFAAVVVPHFGSTVQVFVDHPVGTPVKPLEIDQFAVVAAFNSLFPNNVLHEVVNLYPAVQRLYEAEGEGIVSHLGHTVTTSVKHERMRGPGRCVRKELFHVGGVEAVDGHITPFSIEVVWGADDETMQGFNPSLSIDGTYMMTYQSAPRIDFATLRKCAYYDDAIFVIGRLMDHLRQDDEA